MCGLYGLVKPRGQEVPPQIARHMLLSLALHNQSRGRDGVGFALLEEDRYSLLKRGISTEQLVSENPESLRKLLDRLAELCTSESPFIIIGHTRAKTVGAVSNRNAHPFVLPGDGNGKPFVLGAHNGTVPYWRGIRDKLSLDVIDVEVDSEVLFHGLQKFEESEWLAKISPSARMALTYTINPLEDFRLRVFKDSASTISFRSMPEVNLLVWSSSQGHLEPVTIGFSDSEVFTLENDSLAIWNPNELVLGDTWKKVEGVEFKKIVPNFTEPFFREVSSTVGIHSAWPHRSAYHGPKWEKATRRTDPIVVEINELGDEDDTFLRLVNPDEAEPANNRSWWSVFDAHRDSSYEANIFHLKLSKETNKGTVTRLKKKHFFRRYPQGVCLDSTRAIDLWYKAVQNEKDFLRKQKEKVTERYAELFGYGSKGEEEEEEEGPRGGSSYQKYFDRLIVLGALCVQEEFDKLRAVSPILKAECTSCKRKGFAWKMSYYFGYPFCSTCFVKSCSVEQGGK